MHAHTDTHKRKSEIKFLEIPNRQNHKHFSNNARFVLFLFNNFVFCVLPSMSMCATHLKHPICVACDTRRNQNLPIITHSTHSTMANIREKKYINWFEMSLCHTYSISISIKTTWNKRNLFCKTMSMPFLRVSLSRQKCRLHCYWKKNNSR